MSYTFKVTRQFEKDSKRLGKIIREEILKKLSKLKSGPYSCKLLHRSLKGRYSLRIGDYRVIYKINKTKRNVAIYCVDRLGVVYKRLSIEVLQFISCKFTL